MPILEKRWSNLSNADPPDEYGIYEFGIRSGGGTAIIYIGRARQGSTSLDVRFREHVTGRGNPFVYDAIKQGLEVLYRFEEADSWTDPATMEVEHLNNYRAQHNNQLPPGNRRGESLPAWYNRMGVVIRNWFE